TVGVAKTNAGEGSADKMNPGIMQGAIWPAPGAENKNAMLVPNPPMNHGCYLVPPNVIRQQWPGTPIWEVDSDYGEVINQQAAAAQWAARAGGIAPQFGAANDSSLSGAARLRPVNARPEVDVTPTSSANAQERAAAEAAFAALDTSPSARTTLLTLPSLPGGPAADPYEISGGVLAGPQRNGPNGGFGNLAVEWKNNGDVQVFSYRPSEIQFTRDDSASEQRKANSAGKNAGSDDKQSKRTKKDLQADSSSSSTSLQNTRSYTYNTLARTTTQGQQQLLLSRQLSVTPPLNQQHLVLPRAGVPTAGAAGAVGVNAQNAQGWNNYNLSNPYMQMMTDGTFINQQFNLAFPPN
ncbi:unnamed protein product, partial [Amoebophrya sp. A120]